MARMHRQVFTGAGTYTFNVPAGVTQVLVRAIGGGGGGGGSGKSAGIAQNGCSGGGGGATRLGHQWFSVTPGGTPAVVVGAGGTAGSGSTGGNATAGGNGAASAFNGTIVSTGAVGGAAGHDDDGSQWYAPGGSPDGDGLVGLSVGHVAPTVGITPPNFGGYGSTTGLNMNVPAGWGGGSTTSGPVRSILSGVGQNGGGGGVADWPSSVGGTPGVGQTGAGSPPTAGGNGTLGGGGGGGGGTDASQIHNGVAGGVGGDGAVEVLWWQ